MNCRIPGVTRSRAGTQEFIYTCALLIQKRILRPREGKESSRLPVGKRQERVRLGTHVKPLGHAKQRG